MAAYTKLIKKYKSREKNYLHDLVPNMSGEILWGAVCVKILMTKTQGFGGIY